MLARAWAWYNRYDAWKLMAWVLTILVLVGAYSFDIVEGLTRFAVAMAIGAAVDFFLHRLHTPGYKQWPLSGTITARIVLLVLPFDVPLWLLSATILVALLSKHFLRWQKKHIFNPAAFGIVVVGLLTGLKLGWWGEAVLPLTILLLIPAVYRVKKQYQVATFAVGYLILLVALNPANLTPTVWQFIPWFFTGVMVADPMTSVPTRRQQVIFGAIIALFAIGFSYVSFLSDLALPAALLGGNLAAVYLRTTKL